STDALRARARAAAARSGTLPARRLTALAPDLVLRGADHDRTAAAGEHAIGSQRGRPERQRASDAEHPDKACRARDPPPFRNVKHSCLLERDVVRGWLAAGAEPSHGLDVQTWASVATRRRL